VASRKRLWTGWILGLGLGMGLGGGCACAQTLPLTSDDALHAMTQMAGVIFAGQVVAVRRHDATGGASGVVEIEFAVEDAVRGVSGGRYTLREWAGLWAGGDEPFRVGQRYLILLHSPGPSGLSSPVGGMDGAIPIRGGGLDIGTSMGPEGRTVDLGWVGTRVVKPTAYQPAPDHGPVARPITFRTESVTAASSPATDKVVAAQAQGTPASAQPSTAYTSVLGMLRSWERSDHGAR
jgi:hypothetical protein